MDAMCQDKYPGHIHLTSFTVDAAEQLEEKCPDIGLGGSKEVTSSSTYGMGLRFAKQRGEAFVIDRFGGKYKRLTTEALGGKTKSELDKSKPGLWESVQVIQEKARLDLKWSVTYDDTARYADHFGIDLSPSFVEDATTALNEVLDAGRNNTAVYDFTDMVYQPIIRNFVFKRYETLIVDEFQDMGRAQQELCLGISYRRILIGDPHQAIYGFAGADQEAFERMKKFLGMTKQGLLVLPLNETRRCAKSITRRANELVPELRPLDTAPEGQVIKLSSKSEFYDRFLEELKTIYRQPLVDDKECKVICPTNAPLISLMFYLKKAGIKSYVHGKDITASMQNFVSKCDKGIEELRTKSRTVLEAWLAKRPSKTRDLQIDIYSAILEIANNCTTVDQVINAIKDVFSDKYRPGWLRLSSIHRAKGLEARTIVLWETNNCRSRYSTQPWQHLQDKNLEYVAVTRAINRLIEVRA
jgi:superfamily I DNA/RNA helicase